MQTLKPSLRGSDPEQLRAELYNSFLLPRRLQSRQNWWAGVQN